MKICSKCNYIDQDVNVDSCPECGKATKWIDESVYRNNQRILEEFRKNQKEEREKKELPDRYEKEFQDRKICAEMLHLSISKY